MIEIDNVHKSFGNLEVVKGVNLTVNKGEVCRLSVAPALASPRC